MNRKTMVPPSLRTVTAIAAFAATMAGGAVPRAVTGGDFVVTTIDDAGPGSLRQAILDAAASDGPRTITFDAADGPFGEPQTIVLRSPLPELAGDLTIDGRIEGRLWRHVGVTVSGAGRFRVFTVGRGAGVTIRGLSVADGFARHGGGIASRGHLTVREVSFLDNRARRSGGGLAVLEGTAVVLNSTFAGNEARRGGALAVRGERATVTHCTFSANRARTGGGLFSKGPLLLRNTILAHSAGGSDCVVRGVLDPASTHNIIMTHDGCGIPVSTADPLIVGPGHYQGPTPTFSLKGGSAAINAGDNASAVDETGAPLKWDQRGNGDPRFVAGFVDIGALEHQYVPDYIVDTVEDSGARACTRSGSADCSLRGAIEIANAARRPPVIRFDGALFANPVTLDLSGPLPPIVSDMTIDAGDTAGVTLRGGGPFPITVSAGARVEIRGLSAEGGGPLLDPAGAPDRL